MICPKVLALLIDDKNKNIENLFTDNRIRKSSDELLEVVNKNKLKRKSKVNRL